MVGSFEQERYVSSSSSQFERWSTDVSNWLFAMIWTNVLDGIILLIMTFLMAEVWAYMFNFSVPLLYLVTKQSYEEKMGTYENNNHAVNNKNN